MQVKRVERLIDDCVQVFISPLVAAIVLSNYWKVALASIYVCMYDCMPCKSQVPESLHIVVSPSYSTSVTLLPLSH